jgi:HEAT repeats
MMTLGELRKLAAAGFLASLAPSMVHAQGFERDTKVTGPRGNSITRSITGQRVGPFVDRSVTVTGPRGNSITRNTEVFAPRGGFAPRGFVGGPAVVVGGAPVIGVGLGIVPPVNMFFGGGGGGGVGGPPGPGGPGPMTYYNPPIPYPASTAAHQAAASGTPLPTPPPPPPPGTHVVDPVAENIGKLTSFHGNVRREGSITLGKYGDARAVPTLIDRLQHDNDKDVRMAAAWALAEIGDQRAMVPLETARQFDKRAEVRTVAEKSIARLPRESIVQQAPAQYPMQARVPSTNQAVQNWQASAPASAPAPIESTPAATAPPQRYNLDDLPPPDPTPSSRGGSPR